jgi:type II secretory pathway component PulF
MAIPWFQIARLVPDIVSVSRELLQQTRNSGATMKELADRVARLEQNDRKQAELLAKMAQQLAAMAEAGVSLRRELIILRTLTALALIAAVVALAFAL